MKRNGLAAMKLVSLVATAGESILDWAGTLLATPGFSPAAVLRRNPNLRGWAARTGSLRVADRVG